MTGLPVRANFDSRQDIPSWRQQSFDGTSRASALIVLISPHQLRHYDSRQSIRAHLVARDAAVSPGVVVPLLLIESELISLSFRNDSLWTDLQEHATFDCHRLAGHTAEWADWTDFIRTIARHVVEQLASLTKSRYVEVDSATSQRRHIEATLGALEQVSRDLTEVQIYADQLWEMRDLHRLFPSSPATIKASNEMRVASEELAECTASIRSHWQSISRNLSSLLRMSYVTPTVARFIDEAVHALDRTLRGFDGFNSLRFMTERWSDEVAWGPFEEPMQITYASTLSLFDIQRGLAAWGDQIKTRRGLID
ncbi:hypothetical protein OHA72_18260 [Dactylosporangium sp. NBC_01737]|uniref:hypothetical protein n=1 Tax=Dactylosporangium sp. NBC_01737 TaxID=2975959 RepID=UPI002E101667|nr:hypothetical protein OHA72_18260 [Dactylosporangium sp. NBC_01737]